MPKSCSNLATRHKNCQMMIRSLLSPNKAKLIKVTDYELSRKKKEQWQKIWSFWSGKCENEVQKNHFVCMAIRLDFRKRIKNDW